ncbi:MAG: alpha-galactosidase, partial [Bacilli bacterium]|nr:alpha-galactosidase [Bacilli bacterium]
VKIQAGIALGYPLSVMSNHVSASPSHQLLRNTPIDSRFNVASFGILGYELLFREVEPLERKRIKQLINIYKDNREIFQFGRFSQNAYILDHNDIAWNVINEDKSKQIVMHFNKLQLPDPKDNYLFSGQLNENDTYSLKEVRQIHNLKTFGSLINMVLPVHLNPNGYLVHVISRHHGLDSDKQEYTLKGSVLNKRAIILNSEWSGTGINDAIRVMGDFGSKMYIIEKVNED